MAGKGSKAGAGRRTIPAHVLVIEARYYEDVSDELAAGAVAELERAVQRSTAWWFLEPWRFRRC